MRVSAMQGGWGSGGVPTHQRGSEWQRSNKDGVGPPFPSLTGPPTEGKPLPCPLTASKPANPARSNNGRMLKSSSNKQHGQGTVPDVGVSTCFQRATCMHCSDTRCALRKGVQWVRRIGRAPWLPWQGLSSASLNKTSHPRWLVSRKATVSTTIQDLPMAGSIA